MIRSSGRRQAGGRAVAASMLMVAAAVFLWLYTDYQDGHRVPTASFILPPVAALAIGGLVDPRILWSVGPRRKTFPVRIRIIGAVVFGIGLAATIALMVCAPRI